MVVNHKRSPGCSYLGTSTTPGYCSAILHLRRPMAKLCLSSLFSISLAEFYSSNNLKQTLKHNEKAPVKTKHFDICEFVILSQTVRICDKLESLTYIPCKKTLKQNSFTEECQLLITWIRIIDYLMESVDSLVKVSAVVVAAAALIASSHRKMTRHQCLLLPTGDMAG